MSAVTLSLPSLDVLEQAGYPVDSHRVIGWDVLESWLSAQGGHGTFALCPDCGRRMVADTYGPLSGGSVRYFTCDPVNVDHYGNQSPDATCALSPLAPVDVYLEHNERWVVREGALYVYTVHRPECDDCGAADVSLYARRGEGATDVFLCGTCTDSDGDVPAVTR